MEHVAGETDPVTTGEASGNDGSRDSGSVTVEGPYADVKAITDFDSLVPSDATPTSHKVMSDGHGGGKLVINWIKYGEDGGATATEEDITWRIEMAEVQKPLQCHKIFKESGKAQDLKEIYLWLATSPDRRFNMANGAAQWVDSIGTATPIAQPYALKFVQCYLRGIETYNEYYPVIEKISTYKWLPGATMNKNKTTGGTASKITPFSDIGKFTVPALKLSGYADGGWFKSGDSYAQGGDRVWTRNEQWTWTPDYDDGNVNWIYQKSSQNSST